jgi:hypothetical protein
MSYHVMAKNDSLSGKQQLYIVRFGVERECQVAFRDSEGPVVVSTICDPSMYVNREWIDSNNGNLAHQENENKFLIGFGKLITK